MRTKQRVLTAKLIMIISKNQEYANQVGITIEKNEIKRNDKNREVQNE